MDLVRFIVALFSRWITRSSTSKKVDPRHRLGRRGERWAEKYLRRNRYRILYRNFRPKNGGEVDLVCRDRDEGILAFIEVKTRSSDEFGRPADAVTREKEALICRGARAWLRMLDRPEVPFRFDILEIVLDGDKPRFNHLKSAFILPEEQRR
jgi:putative endonuclease